MNFHAPRSLAWLLLLLLSLAAPPAAPGASIALQEYDAVLHSKPDSVHGEALFGTCAMCHGADGGGKPDGSVPVIAAQHFRVIARELVDYRHDKRWDLRMENFASDHHLKDPKDIADVASFIADLAPAHGVGVGSGEFAAHGAEIYSHLCAGCHGPNGEGDDARRYPRLAGQHFAYLLRQLHDAVEGRRPNFPAEHVRLLEHFDKADLNGVADYLSRLRSADAR
jgi:cytochrome c553